MSYSFHFGFTGTQDGLTDLQRARLEQFFSMFPPSWLHYGDCIGADIQAAEMAMRKKWKLHMHPPSVSAKRAFGHWDKREDPKDYMDRNTDIACAAVNGLVTCPKEMEPQQRSGTWSTVRRAQKIGRSVFLFYPDGTLDTL